jgi:hypothetical protein
MNDELVPDTARPLTLEAARYALQLRQLARFGKHLESSEAAVRQLADRLEALAAELRRHATKLETLNETAAEHSKVTIRAIESLLVAIAEKNLSSSISRSVVENVYAQVTPLLEEHINAIGLDAAKTIDQSKTEMSRALADAVRGKAPVPPPPPSNAPLSQKILLWTVRATARAQRFCITVAPPLGCLAALTAIFYYGRLLFLSVR